MRYQDTGELHKDFHLATNRTITYIVEAHGEKFLRALCKRTSQQVYRDIYQRLRQGELAALTEHWRYYYTRERGVFELQETSQRAELRVIRCPAASHILDRTGELSPYYYQFILMLIEYWVEDTPFTCRFDLYSSTSYTIQVRRAYASQ